MSGRYAAYPEYQESGLDWLGKIPKSWGLKRLGSYFQERRTKVSDTAFSALSVTMQGIVPQLENAAKTSDGDNRKLVRSGDFVINSRSDRKGSSGVSPYDGSVSLISIVLEPVGIYAPFVHHLLRSTAFQEEFYRFGRGIVADLWSTNYSAMKNILIPAMSHREQTQIAKFLDYETAKIDALIAKQQQLIALLQEKRQAVISHAVTKGLNPAAPLRDSGVEWLGQVPAHWEVMPLKHHIQQFDQGWSPQCEQRPAGEGEWGIMKVGCVNGGVFNRNENKCLPDTLVPQMAYILRKGDLLISRANTRELVGSAAVVLEDEPNLQLCDKLYRLRLGSVPEAQFISHYLETSLTRQQLELEATGASHSMQNITQDTIRNLPVPIPPLQEVNEIVAELKHKLIVLDSIMIKGNTLIDTLQERRTALIAAAVTGKIDVRGWQPPLANPAGAPP